MSFPTIGYQRVGLQRGAALFNRTRGGILTTLFVTVLLGCLTLQLWTHVTRTSATFDEPVHILAGYRYWHCADYTVNAEHPPLLKLLATVPLLWRHLDDPEWPCGWISSGGVESARVAALFLARHGIDSILIPARVAAALVSVMLAVLVCVAAHIAFGRAAAMVALALFVFEPNLIAHGSLVTTDMVLTATLFFAVCALYGYCCRPSVVRLLVTGGAMGLLLASKHTGLLMLPVLFVLLIADVLYVHPRVAQGKGLVRSVLSAVAAYLVMLLLAVAVLWGSYGFRYYARAGVAQETGSIAGFLGSARVAAARSMPGQLIGIIHAARIFPESYTFGLAGVLAGSERRTYLLGRVYPAGRWFYFPVAFAIKSSIALLLLLPLALLARDLYRTHPRQVRFLLLPSTAYFAMSLASHINIGVRHLLPVYPFFIVIAAAGACAWSRRGPGFVCLVAVVLLYHGATAWRIAPDYIAFSNDFWGGPKNTYRWLNDSNVDWGQGLKQVEAYLHTNAIHDCWFAAFGMADLVREYHTCRKLPSPGWDATEQLVDPVPPVIDGTVLISAWDLPPWGGPEYVPITQTQKVDVIGGSVLVFRGHFDVPLLAALSYRSRAIQLLGRGRWVEALADAQKAVELGPNDSRTHAVLAIAYARNGMQAEAQQEDETARSLPLDARE